MNYPKYAADVVAMDLINGFIPRTVRTMLDLVGYYRDQFQPLTVTGLSIIIEQNPGIGSLPYWILL